MNQTSGLHDALSTYTLEPSERIERHAPLVNAATILLSFRRWFVVAFVLVASVIVFLGYPRHLTYTSVGSFVADIPRQNTSGVSNLASQLGLNLGGLQAGVTTPLFYPELIRSPQFLQSVAESRFAASGPGDTNRVTLREIFGIKAESPDRERQLAGQTLHKFVSVSVSPQTGIVN
ncbi:MAG: hypothetical protein ACREXY_28045, partial [Gammaproteobacteria bacterium]